jgi:hypothetical protein
MIIKAATLRILARAQYLDAVQSSGHFTKKFVLNITSELPQI